MSLSPASFPTDLDRVADIVMDSFQYPENPDWGLQDDEQQTIVETIQSLKRLWPLIRVISLLYPGVRDVLCGLLATDDGQDAGVLLYQPMSPTGSPAWVIGTVAVKPGFRRKGLGKQMVAASIDDMLLRGARTATLSVFSRNAPAYSLYEAAGFAHYATSVELVRDADAEPPPKIVLPERYTIQASPASDWRRRLALARRVTPAPVQVYRPVTESNFHPPALLRLFSVLLNRLSGQSERHFLATLEDRQQESDVVASASCAARTRSGGFNTLSVRLDAEHGDLAQHLVARMTRELALAAPGRRIELSVPDWSQPTIEAALACGFRERLVWHQMGLTLE